MRPLLFATLASLALLLGGCAGIGNLSSEVSTYGPWPAERKPSTFTFERLPSQQAEPERQQQLETAARGALEATGFRAAADAKSAEYLMQIGARVTSSNPWIYNDPLFWRGPFRYGPGFGAYSRWGRGWGPGWGYGGYGGFYDSPSFEREVAIVIRDQKTGQLLYEARASNAGPSASIDYLMPAMFEAALKNFPAAGPNPRNVVTQISKQ
jgi:Domain of unknown function (DUF4136)